MNSTAKMMRGIASAMLRRVNPGDITITHPWTGNEFVVHSYHHKGYWYHRANRERALMIMLARLLQPGWNVVEVGAHIGFITVWLAEMVGPKGSVVAFEPTPVSAGYLRRNTEHSENVVVTESAVADTDESVTLYVEEESGQMNSLLKDFQGLEVETLLGRRRIPSSAISVNCVRLDSCLAATERPIDLLKVDVEGAELRVLRGAEKTLSRHRPILTLEVSSYEAEAIDEFLFSKSYVLFDDRGRRIESACHSFNVVALHRDHHSHIIDSV